jgi:hypothetical protein
MEVGSYGKVFAISDQAVFSQFSGPVEVEEKIDGSQFSVMVTHGGQRLYRSKGCEVFPGHAGMFDLAVESLSDLPFLPGHTYRFEYLRKPKHNTLCYGRVPSRHCILFEIEADGYNILPHAEVAAEAGRLGLECVPLLYQGPMPSFEFLDSLLDTESVLGREKIEGVVIKARTLRHLQDGKVLKAKLVSDRFKERHSKDWKKANPGAKDIKAEIADCLRTDARFQKAVQLLRDSGELTGSVRDIGPLMRVLGQDLHAEQAEWVKEQLFKWAWPEIQRRANHGFPEWYKARLLEEAALTA